MNDKTAVLKILARALLDIRMASIEGNTKASFAISDFVHTIPLQIQIVSEGEGSYREIIKHLKERAITKEMDIWLNHALKEIGYE
jgi:hypothetical protein